MQVYDYNNVRSPIYTECILEGKKQKNRGGKYE